MHQQRGGGRLALWGGVECTVNRVGNAYHSQLDFSGHATRESDIERFASLGIAAIRYPILWERTAPAGLAAADWTWPDRRLSLLGEAGITPIAGLLHHGSGPTCTDLLDPHFPEKFAAYAGAVAARYPHLDHYTPINEPLTTARFSALYGHWHPHARDERAFAVALLNQCKATVLAMAAVWEVNSDARLIQTEDLGRTYSVPSLLYQAEFNNELRWLGWDLLSGLVDREHTLWRWLTRRCGVPDADLLWFCDQPCVPSLIGVNYYVTSERYLDPDLSKYPVALHGGNGRDRYVDVEAARSPAGPTAGVGPLLDEAWGRYHVPLAVTEAHIDSTREDQLRWLTEIWQQSQAARSRGVDVRAVTVWALLGSFDWNCLVTSCPGYYEPGAFDLRSPEPRETAVAHWMRRIASHGGWADPVVESPGWWRRRTSGRRAPRLQDERRRDGAGHLAAPILIAGTGTLCQSIAACCHARGLAFVMRAAEELDITNADDVEIFIDRHKPWAVVIADDNSIAGTGTAPKDQTTPVLAPDILAAACFDRGLPLVSFSSEHVFDGQATDPYRESAPTSPIGKYAALLVEAERGIMACCPTALIVRTGNLFGMPADKDPMVRTLNGAVEPGLGAFWSENRLVTPTFMPDLAHACLDLIIDRASGIVHLTHETVTTWPRALRQVADLAGLDSDALVTGDDDPDGPAPTCGALVSERCHLLPSLESAFQRYASLLPSYTQASRRPS